MPTETFSKEASCCRRLAAKLKRKEEKRLMLRVAKAFEELAAKSARKGANGEVTDLVEKDKLLTDKAGRPMIMKPPLA